MWAILSDIHANLPALDAVLADIMPLGVEKLICLGNIVGQGPDPVACIDRTRMFDNVLMGQFDEAVLYGDGTGWPSKDVSTIWKVLLWNRAELDATAIPELYWNYLASRPRMRRFRDVLLVYGSPRNPMNDYIFPEDIYNTRRLQSIFRVVPRISFVGASHMQGILVRRGDELYDWVTVNDGERYPDGPEQKIVCVGSVGQPHDNDPRAAYVLYDGNEFIFRRVPYDYEETIARIKAITEFDDFCADRLREGR